VSPQNEYKSFIAALYANLTAFTSTKATDKQAAFYLSANFKIKKRERGISTG